MSTTSVSSTDPAYSYDDVPYPSHPYEATHPDNIFSIAKLFQFDATPPDNARILELGCASGGNLIPLAVQMPSAKFVGVDLSSKQIGEGLVTVEKLGLKNISLEAKSFEELGKADGKFDYILCHGVFSWVPPTAQLKIFEICRDLLTPNGIAYISYNAYPGWFMRGMIREMMLHHVKNVSDPIQKVKQARAFLTFLVESTEGQTNTYAQSIKQELDLLSKHSDSYLFHEHLEAHNQPMFFYQFMDKAKSYGLQFMSETNLASMVTSNLPAKAAESLTKLTNDLYHRSQYTDFVTNRMFRQSLLCSASHKINRHIDESRVEGALFSGAFQTDITNGVQDIDPNVEVTFKCSNGRSIKTKNAALKALLFTLANAWPSSLSMKEIAESVSQKLSQVLVIGEQQQISIPKVCASFVVQLMVRGDIDFRFIPNRFTTNVSERPCVSALARYQARTGAAITTQRHQLLNPDAISRLLIQVIDGTKTKEDLVDVVSQLIASGNLKVTVQNGQNVDMSTIHRITVDKAIEQLRKNALLVG
jgi:methyltransferase-like protein/cyclopropane fatty-acyl-phospholipid synthase-like methyltransferase